MRVSNLLGKYLKLFESLHTLTYTDNRQKQMCLITHSSCKNVLWYSNGIKYQGTLIFIMSLNNYHINTWFYMILKGTSNNTNIFYHIICPKNMVLPWNHVQKHHSTTKMSKKHGITVEFFVTLIKSTGVVFCVPYVPCKSSSMILPDFWCKIAIPWLSLKYFSEVLYRKYYILEFEYVCSSNTLTIMGIMTVQSLFWAYKTILEDTLAPVQRWGSEATLFGAAQVFWSHSVPLEPRYTAAHSVSVQTNERAGVKRADYGKKCFKRHTGI